MTIQQIKSNEQFTLLSVLPATALVYQAGAVIGSVNRKLINVGSFVKFSASPGEVNTYQTLIETAFSTLLIPTCRWTLDSQLPASQHLESHFVLYNRLSRWTHLVFQCAMNTIALCLPYPIYLDVCVPSICISHSVSVMHECSVSCVFRHVNTTATVERREVRTRKLCFVHDFSNNLYSLNVYCMHSIYS